MHGRNKRVVHAPQLTAGVQMLLCLMILTGLTAGVQDHEGSTVNVTLSNTFLPKDTDGRLLQTEELQVFDNHNRDGYWCVFSLQLRTPLTALREAHLVANQNPPPPPIESALNQLEVESFPL